MKLRFIYTIILFTVYGCKTVYNVEGKTEVKLNNKNIKNDSKIEIRNIKNIKSLDLSSNNLTKFPSFLIQAESLEKLFLGYNKIDSIPDEISNLKKLRTLGIASNPIKYISPEISKLKKLKYIFLRGGYDQNTIKSFRNVLCKDVRIIIYTESPNPYGLKECGNE